MFLLMSEPPDPESRAVRFVPGNPQYPFPDLVQELLLFGEIAL
jgi:hypothetical protein